MKLTFKKLSLEVSSINYLILLPNIIITKITIYTKCILLRTLTFDSNYYDKVIIDFEKIIETCKSNLTQRTSPLTLVFKRIEIKTAIYFMKRLEEEKDFERNL